MPFIDERINSTERTQYSRNTGSSNYTQPSSSRTISLIERYHTQVMYEYQRVCCMASEYDRKQVYQIQCKDCGVVLSNRGMNAVLLSDRSVELFSTDLRPNTVGFVYGDYCAASCQCRVRDTACLNCGNAVGYHVNLPCKSCLSEANNGHYWMFRCDSIKGANIYMIVGSSKEERPLLWGFVDEPGNYSSGSNDNVDPDGNSVFYDEDTASALSSQLSVTLGSSITLYVMEPRMEIVKALQTAQVDIKANTAVNRNLSFDGMHNNHTAQMTR